MRKFSFPHTNNNGGAVLLYVLVISLIVVGIFTSTMLTNQNAEKQLYQARFRNQLDVFETRWQTLLSQPSSYINCKFDTPNSCQLNPAILKQYQSQSMIGGGCGKPKAQQSREGNVGSNDSASAGGAQLPTCNLSCGFCAAVTLNDSVATLTVNPVGTFLRPLVAQIQIPYDILQQQTISCPLIDPSKPRFAGLDAKGNAICLPLQSPKCQYPGVQFAVGISPGTGAIVCRNIPNLKITCPDDSFISGFGWTVSAIGRACAVRKWPYVFNYYSGQTTVAANATPAPTSSTPTPSATATPDQCIAHYIDPNGKAVYDDASVARCDENGKPKVGGANMCPGWGVDDCGASYATTTTTSSSSSSGGEGGGIGGKGNASAGGGTPNGNDNASNGNAASGNTGSGEAD